jgi:hypothetical protein
MKLQRSALVLALSTALCGPAFAADHRDSPLATNDPAADINDVYTFTNPNDPDELIVAMTVSPVANSNTRFSDAVEYRVHLDNGAAGGVTTITCTFPDEATRVLCRNAGDTLYADGPLNQTVDADDLRVWAGLRDDPFFFDLDAFNRTRATLVPSFTNPGVNFFAGLNTLVIVLGIEHDRLTNNGANSTLKLYGSTNRIGDAGVGASLTGMWYDAANPGHGFVLHVIDGAQETDPNQLVTYWAVYDQGAQLNLYGVGPIPANGTSATVPVVSHIGGQFPPAFRASQITEVPFGSLTFNFTDCNTGSVQVQPTRAGFAPTTVSLKRLTQVVDLPCSFLSTGQIDRMGRPGINTALIDLLASTGKKDAYNRAANPAAWAGAFQSEIQSNLAALDTLDGTPGNAVLPAAALAPVLVDDRLVVNASVATCDAYLAVELGVAGQCGGRTLARDVIDDTLGAVVGPGVRDNVANDSTFLADFPFLGRAN